MAEIVELTGGNLGPSGGSVEPRACKYCGFYGHTRQHCEKRRRRELASIENEICKHKREMKQRARVIVKELPWWQRRSQSEWFDELGIPWYMDECLGAMPTVKTADE